VSISTFHILFMFSALTYSGSSKIQTLLKFQNLKNIKIANVYLARGDEWVLQKTTCGFCSRPLPKTVQPQKGRDTHPVGKQLCSEQITKLQNGQRFQHNLRCKCQ
jgi:thioredoxin-related protein